MDPQILWSTGDPWSSHWLAGKLAEKYRLPWVADFRDPWVLGEFQQKNNSRFARQINRRQEEKCIQKASLLTFTSHQTEKLYLNEYGSKISDSETVPNSFDSILFNSSQTKSKYFDDRYLNLLFFGRFRPLSPAQWLIDLLHDIYQQQPDIAQSIRIYSFGSLTEDERQYAIAKNVYDNFIILKPIALENALPILSQADILWLSTHPDMRNIIPAKLWDYLAAKRPIISVVPNHEVKGILQQTGSGVHFDTTEAAPVIDLLIRSVKAKMHGNMLPIPTSFDEDQIKQYDAPATTARLAGIFDRLT